MNIVGLTRTLGPRTIFHDLHLSVNPSEIVFVVGRSGAGKSLLLRAIAGLDAVDGGHVVVHGVGRSDALPSPQWRAEVMYVGQSRVDLPGTPRDAVLRVVGLAVHRETRGLSVDDVAGEWERAVVALDLDGTHMDRPWNQLSGGEAQRMWLAIAVALRPKVLMLDEPSSACDPQSTLKMEQFVVDLGLPTLWVSHESAQPTRVGGRVFQFPPASKAPEDSSPQVLDSQAPERRTNRRPRRPRFLGLIPAVLASTIPGAAAAVVLHHLDVASQVPTPVADAMAVGQSNPVFLSGMTVWGASLMMIAVAIGLSVMQLGLGDVVILATIRCIVQLTLLGYILLPIFSINNPILVTLYISVMVLSAAAEAIGRPQYLYKGIFTHTVQSIAFGSLTFGALGLWALFGVGLDAQYAIPIVGMLLGNTLTGISVALNTVLTESVEGKDLIEKLLMMGATRWEATDITVRRAVNVGLTPSLNQASVAGLVSIPGMMTGQLLGGTGPAQAARYQILLILLIVASCTVSVVSTSLLAVASMIDRSHRLQQQRILPGRPSWSRLLSVQLQRLWNAVMHGLAVAASVFRRQENGRS